MTSLLFARKALAVVGGEQPAEQLPTSNSLNTHRTAGDVPFCCNMTYEVSVVILLVTPPHCKSAWGLPLCECEDHYIWPTSYHSSLSIPSFATTCSVNLHILVFPDKVCIPFLPVVSTAVSHTEHQCLFIAVIFVAKASL
ncbi:hypothetical protein PC128_g23549 [Phytophthora cactorum]|nr:hypothetical protein PC128_g23549 [Phytophthora cactorum]